MKLTNQNIYKLYNWRCLGFYELKRDYFEGVNIFVFIFSRILVNYFNENVTASLFAFQWSLRAFTHQHIWSTIISVKVRRLMNEKWHKRGPFLIYNTESGPSYSWKRISGNEEVSVMGECATSCHKEFLALKVAATQNLYLLDDFY